MIYVTNGVQTTDRHLAKTRKNKSESVLHNLHQNKSQLDQIFTWKKMKLWENEKKSLKISFLEKLGGGKAISVYVTKLRSHKRKIKKLYCMNIKTKFCKTINKKAKSQIMKWGKYLRFLLHAGANFCNREREISNTNRLLIWRKYKWPINMWKDAQSSSQKQKCELKQYWSIVSKVSY